MARQRRKRRKWVRRLYFLAFGLVMVVLAVLWMVGQEMEKMGILREPVKNVKNEESVTPAPVAREEITEQEKKALEAILRERSK